MTSVDVVVENHGTLCLLRLETLEAREWVEANVNEERQTWCGSLVVEPRYLVALVRGMLEDGLEVC